MTTQATPSAPTPTPSLPTPLTPTSDRDSSRDFTRSYTQIHAELRQDSAELQRQVLLWQRWIRYAAVLVLLLPAYVGGMSTYQYFGPVQADADFRYTYPYQMDAASHYMAGLSADTTVYFYSGHWSIDYETRRFIAPGVRGVDRSLEFREPSRAITSAPLDLEASRSHDVAFVFLDPYLGELDSVVRRYPGGTVTEVERDSETLFRAYYLPAVR